MASTNAIVDVLGPQSLSLHQVFSQFMQQVNFYVC